MDTTCHVEPLQKIATREEQQSTTLIRLSVQGLGCPNCAARVRNSLLALKGITEAEVDHLTGTADVEFNPSLVTIPALCEAVARAGNDGRHRYRAFSLSNVDPLSLEPKLTQHSG
ncbi:MAG: heavy-metal-associated domain-containing protein [Chloroflexi bacterium]|nr:heavy-metal-associated domain-containing protein [Chloroflexota bacterium]